LIGSLGVVLVEYGLPLLLAIGVVTVWKASSPRHLASTIRQVGRHADEHAFVIPTDTLLRPLPAAPDISFDVPDLDDFLGEFQSWSDLVGAANKTLATVRTLGQSQSLRLGDVLAVENDGALFIYAALFDPRFKLQDPRDPSSPSSFIQPAVVTSAAMSALIAAERHGVRVLTFKPFGAPDPWHPYDDIREALRHGAYHLQSVDEVFYGGQLLFHGARGVKLYYWDNGRPTLPVPGWMVTPLPWPGGDAFGAPRLVHYAVTEKAFDPAINPAYLATDRATILPALLYVLVVGAVLFACLCTGPDWQRRVFRLGVILGFVSVVPLVILQDLLASFWIWIPNSWIATTPGLSFVGAAVGLLVGRSVGELRHVNRVPPPALPEWDSPLRSILHSDRPIEDINQDRLGFAPLVSALHRFLDNPDTRPPVVLAVNGPWGSGKSSLMKMLATELDKTGRFRIVWHNSWQYHREEQVLAAFLQSIASQLSERWGPWFALRLAWTRFKEYSYWQHLALLVSLTSALVGLWALQRGLSSDDLHPVATAAAGAAGLGGLAWIREVLLPFRLRFRKLWTVGDQSKRLGFLEEFTREFQLYREAIGSRSKFLIVIDDLDRCPPEHVVDVLKTINLIITGGVGAGRSFFVLGYDANYILRSINAYYRDLAGQRDPFDVRFGPQYLKKMVTVSVSVPKALPEDIKGMVAALDREEDEGVGPAAPIPPRDLLARIQNTPKWVPRFALALATTVFMATIVGQTDMPSPAVTEAPARQEAPATPQAAAGEVPSVPFPNVELPSERAISWWFWLPFGALAGAAGVLLQLRARPRSPEPAYRREASDPERFRTAIDRCANLLPNNPRDVVRTVNLMRLIYLLMEGEVNTGTQASGGPGVGSPRLDEWECVSYTLLQQRHPELFDPAPMKVVLENLSRAIEHADPASAYAAVASRLKSESGNGSIASDISALKKAGGEVGHFGDTTKLRRFLDVNGYVLEVGAQLSSEVVGSLAP
jgi:hypothetical protein